MAALSWLVYRAPRPPPRRAQASLRPRLRDRAVVPSARGTWDGAGGLVSAAPPARAPPPFPRSSGGDGMCSRRGRPRAISSARLRASQPAHLRPIDVIVSDGPPRRSHLGGGFALRCLQRLSRPHSATLRCRWRDSRHTGGASDTVLSY